MKSLLLLFCIFIFIGGNAQSNNIASKINSRTYPSVFQAWYGIDMPEYPIKTAKQRLKVAAKHDLLWEEPLSQLGENVDLVLGLVWDNQHHGLATSFTKKSLKKAKANKAKLLKENPNMVLLLEIRWRDAPSSFLPENSDWWKRNDKGEIVKGWLGGWEPFYMLNYENTEFQDNVARQAKIALESGVYDGIMLDWSGHEEIARKIRSSIGQEGLIIINLHDDIHDAEKFKDVINGSFMELNPSDESTNTASGGKEEKNLRSWDNIQKALVWFEENFQQPTVNCLEVWGDRKDLARMRALTTLGLTHSDGYILYADPNPLKTPDHLHDWYSVWDVNLGKPVAKMTKLPNGAFRREFENGTAVYNHYKNGKVTVAFDKQMKRASDGKVAKEFEINDRDGDLFLPIK